MASVKRNVILKAQAAATRESWSFSQISVHKNLSFRKQWKLLAIYASSC
jgi:hypothetical protein